MSLETYIQKILKIRNREFSRLRKINFDEDNISTDCMGLVYLLLQHQRVLPKGITEKSKVKDLFNWALQAIHKTNIKDIRRNDLLMWKKDNSPAHGDTGHVLIVRSIPICISTNTYIITILEVSRLSNGPCLRELTLHTSDQGEVLAIQWHPEKKKVKKTKILVLKVFKREICSKCQFTAETCLCASLPSQQWQAPPFKILQDKREKKVSIRSTRVLELCFLESQSLYTMPQMISPSSDSVLIFPNKKARMLKTDNDFAKLKERNLILLDGSWKQVKAMLLSYPHLQQLESAQFTRSALPLYKIRKAPTSQHFSTLESYSFLWKKIYPAQYTKALKLEEVFSEMIEKQIQKMGRETYLKNYSHYPGFEY